MDNTTNSVNDYTSKMNLDSFDEYASWFDKFKNNNDIREINFQNEVVKKLINVLCDDLDVVNCANKGADTTNHDYFQYCGGYYDKNNNWKASTPDLVIAKGWNWHNKKNIVDYRAVVEVKSPYLQPIYHKDSKKYGSYLKKKLSRHLSAHCNEKVILTDALKWEFYKKSNGLTPIKKFKLYDLHKRGKWDWSDREFNQLKQFLLEFLKEEN